MIYYPTGYRTSRIIYIFNKSNVFKDTAKNVVQQVNLLCRLTTYLLHNSIMKTNMTLSEYLQTLLITNFTFNNRQYVICTSSFEISRLVKVELLKNINELPLWCRPSFIKNTIRETAFSSSNNSIIIINNPKELKTRSPSDVAFYKDCNLSFKDYLFLKQQYNENLRCPLFNSIRIISQLKNYDYK